MATRQRTRSSRKSPPPPTLSGDQLSGTSTEERVHDSEVLRSSFDTTPFEEGNATGPDRPYDSDAPKATFVGEQIISGDRDARVAKAAYLRAERRGFSPGYELDDWLAAEKEIDAQLSSDRKSDAS